MKLPPIKPDRNKYDRGFLVGFGGSKEFKGAIKLSGRAALRAGAGVVRLFSLDDIGELPDELIFQLFQKRIWDEALLKAHAVMIGPGLGRTAKVKKWLLNELSQINQPVVLDADALFFLPEIKQWPKKAILTPHTGEMIYLLGGKKDSLLARAEEYAHKRDVTLVLKGPTTHIFSPGHAKQVVSKGDPGMATAGSGDVLTGIIGALLAQRMNLQEAAVLGVYLHGLSGEAAAKRLSSYCMTAPDLIDHFPEALGLFRNSGSVDF